MSKTNGPRGNAQATLDQMSRLLEQGDTEALYLAAGEVLAGILRRVSESLSNLNAVPVIDRDLVLRCMACKASRTWQAILCLINAGHPQSALALLRSLTEELVFSSYLLSLPDHLVDEYLESKTMIEIWGKLIAQDEFFPAAAKQFASKEVPIRPTNDALIKETKDAMAALKRRLREMAKESGWPKGDTGTVRDMAIAGGLEPLYNFIYRASSSAVHASLHELGRMVWGSVKKRKFRISHDALSTHYKMFVLVYGGWVASFAADLFSGHFRKSMSMEDGDSLGIVMALYIEPTLLHRRPQLVTFEELQWPVRSEGTGKQKPRSGASRAR